MQNNRGASPPSVYFDDFVKTLPSLQGKTVAVTGCTTGTGFIYALTVAKLGGTVIMLNRASDRAETAFAAVKEAAPGATVLSIPCDLLSFKSVRAAAAAVIAACPQGLDVLCNNAGIMCSPNVASEDGFNCEMQANHLSHFLLTAELWPLLEKAPEGRVVNHSSGLRQFGFLFSGGIDAKFYQADVSQCGGDGSIGRFRRYGQSKLANAVFTHALATKQSKVKALAAHPGVAASMLAPTAFDSGVAGFGAAFFRVGGSQQQSQVCMYVCMQRFGDTSTRACTRTQARGATSELRRVTDTTSHGLSAGGWYFRHPVGELSARHRAGPALGTQERCVRGPRRGPPGRQGLLVRIQPRQADPGALGGKRQSYRREVRLLRSERSAARWILGARAQLVRWSTRLIIDLLLISYYYVYLDYLLLTLTGTCVYVCLLLVLILYQSI